MFKSIYFPFPFNQSYRLWKLLSDLTIDWLSIFDFYFIVSFYRFLYRCLYLLRKKERESESQAPFFSLDI